MRLTSKISPYDPRWPAFFEATHREIAVAFGTELVAIHHVGSTAVVGLAAKPEIDVLIEVSEHRNEVQRGAVLAGLGYQRGGDLSAGHHFYRRDISGVRTHKLHVCSSGHAQIAWMLGFRDLLRRDAGVRQRYQALKLDLEANHAGDIGDYLARKAPFIEEMMQTWNEQ